MRRAAAFARSRSGVGLGALVVAAVAAVTVVAGREAAAGGEAAAPAVSTSFGRVTILRAETLGVARLSHSHGRLRLRLSVEFTNRLDRPVRYSPGQLRLRPDGRSPSTAALRASIPPGVLAPGASARAEIDFVVQRRTKTFVVDFYDVERARPLELELGQVGAAPGRHDDDSGHDT